jgi:uncharacterized protein (DUF4415 family)
MSSRSAKRRAAKRTNSSRASRTDWKHVRALRDEDIVLTDESPEIDPKHIVNAIVRVGLKPPPKKVSISLRIDSDVLEWFKAQGQGYQTRINAVLREFRYEMLKLDSE